MAGHSVAIRIEGDSISSEIGQWFEVVSINIDVVSFCNKLQSFVMILTMMV